MAHLKTFYASSHYSGFHRPKQRPFWQRLLMSLFLLALAGLALGCVWWVFHQAPWWPAQWTLR